MTATKKDSATLLSELGVMMEEQERVNDHYLKYREGNLKCGAAAASWFADYMETVVDLTKEEMDEVLGALENFGKGKALWPDQDEHVLETVSRDLVSGSFSRAVCADAMGGTCWRREDVPIGNRDCAQREWRSD